MLSTILVFGNIAVSNSSDQPLLLCMVHSSGDGGRLTVNKHEHKHTIYNQVTIELWRKMLEKSMKSVLQKWKNDSELKWHNILGNIYIVENTR